MKRFILLLLLVTAASAVTLSDYPSFFVEGGKFKAIYVISDESPALDVISATVISTALAKYPNITTDIGTAKLDSEVNNVLTRNAIVIASPCDSKAAMALEGNPDPCYANLGGSAGYIKLYEHNGKVQMLITGLTAQDRNAAAKFIAQQPLSNLKISSYILPTRTNSTPPFFDQKRYAAQMNVTANVTPPAPVQENVTVQNVTPIVKNDTPALAPKPVPALKYQPLREVPMPQQKSWLDRLMAWIRSLFI